MFENRAMALSESLQSSGLIKEFPALGSLQVKFPRQCLIKQMGSLQADFFIGFYTHILR